MKNFKQTGQIDLGLTNSEKVITEVKHKAQRIISELQIEHLQQIIQILQNDIFAKTQREYFIVIDDLDKDWVDSTIVYDLIKGLIEVIKELRRIPNVKIAIALRTNIDQIIFKKNKTRGVQEREIQSTLLNHELDKGRSYFIGE
jgi:hypothetical protein